MEERQEQSAGDQRVPETGHLGPADFAERAYLPFPVVGIGASAGGVEALEHFFDGARADSGMAYVVVQHLSPEHQSLMAEILARHTSMPVIQIRDGMIIAANHVYVIAPGFTLTIRQGRLHLGEPVEKRGHRRPVDDFFRSLAEEQKERAIAVILSGTGTNGTAGAQAIKAAGGICIAQDPETAAFPGMPRSLIHAGYADQVLTPHDIPAILQKYASHPYVGQESDALDAEELLERDRAHLREVLAILRTRTRHDFGGYRKATLLRRIRRRMGLSEASTIGDYAAVLRESPEEVTSLANDLMINVTGFFRDPEAWEALRVGVIAPLVASQAEGQPIRAWVTACASGEEAYSLAMLIAEEARTQGRLDSVEAKIFATDTADKSLALARAGVYPGGIEGDLSLERLERFFEKDEYTYRIKKEIRDMVVFAPQDVLRDPPFSRVDLCTCRNLLIYLEPETQRRVTAMLHFSLRDGGYMFLGNTETFSGSEHLFEMVSKKWRIYRRTGSAQHRFAEVPSFPGFSLRAPDDTVRLLEPPALTSGRPSPTLMLQRALLERYGPPTLVVDRTDQIMYFHGATDAFLQHPAGEPTRDLLQLVRPSLRMAVRTALRTATRENQPSQAQVQMGEAPGSLRTVEVTAEPVIQGKSPDYFMVSFRFVSGPGAQSQHPQGDAADNARSDAQPEESPVSEAAAEIRLLRGELQNTIEAFEATSEELKASNEEAISINEELQSSNEELETGKEELQSVNEELTTVNSQLQMKIAQLEATTNDLANLLSSTDIAVVFLDSDFRVRRFTPAVSDLLELIESDIGRRITDLAQKFTDGNLLVDAHSVLQRLVPVEREVRSHSGRWYLRRTLPYRTAENRIEGVVITFVDVGARKRAEQEILAAHERVQAVLEQMPMAILITQAPSGRLMFANRQAEALFPNVAGGIPQQDRDAPALLVIQGRHAGGRAYRPEEWPLARSLARNEVITDEEVEVTNPAGETRILSVSASPVRDASGVTVAAVGAFSDITQRKTTAGALRDAEERVRLFVEKATDFAIIFTDPDRKVMVWNTGAARMFGWTRDEIVGRPIDTLFTAEDRALGTPRSELQQAAQNGRAADERWHIRKDGSRFWASSVLASLGPSADGRGGFVKFMRDSTEHKLTEDQLYAATVAAKNAQAEAVSANKSKDEFISTVSHELRTPLNTIRLWTRMLQSDKLPDSDRLEGIRMIERAAIAQQQLVDDLLDVSRIASGKLRLALRETRLAGSIQDAVEAVRPVSENRGIHFSSQISDDIGIVRADPDRIQQIVWNLLSNAVKFTPSGGRVEVVARRDRDAVEIKVTDTGIGIRKEFLAHVFDRFRQAEAGAARSHGGLGLGLAIAKQLAELHRGSIEANSEGEGHGTTFTVRMPLPGRSGSPEDPTAEIRNPGEGLSGAHILLVEDEAGARDTTRRLLQGYGARVVAVESAAAAREAIAIQWPDVIISDIGLPGVDGYQLLKSIRAQSAGGARVPALALTAFARSEDRQMALSAGFDEHLAKPVDPDRLLAIVARLARKAS
ncbi:MAG: torS [Gammaproteobacteria bacterium]|nr:torS [Gammaproteobacteria bacterium]